MFAPPIPTSPCTRCLISIIFLHHRLTDHRFTCLLIAALSPSLHTGPKGSNSIACIPKANSCNHRMRCFSAGRPGGGLASPSPRKPASSGMEVKQCRGLSLLAGSVAVVPEPACDVFLFSLSGYHQPSENVEVQRRKEKVLSSRSLAVRARRYQSR